MSSSSSVIDLIGDTLLDNKFNSLSTEEVLKGKAGFLLYFSASWCGPCKRFTPQLSDVYQKALKEKGEVIFVTRDRSEEAFKNYFEDMPWKAIPYSSPKINQLVQQFEISGIPALLQFSSEGELLTKDGRTFVAKDPEALRFPWRDATIRELIGDVVDKDGEKTLSDNISSHKYVGVLFNAKWCPIQEPIDVLKSIYSKLKNRGESFEIVFASLDKTEPEFTEYLSSMPWKAIPFDRSLDIQLLNSRLQVSSIPSLVFFDTEKDWKIVSTEGLSFAMEDPEGNDFPWAPKALSPLSNESMSLMNNHNLMVVLAEGDNHEEVKKTVETVVEKKKVEWEKLESFPLYFAFGDKTLDEEFSQNVKEFFQWDDGVTSAAIVQGTAGLLFPYTGDFSEESLTKFVDSVLSGSASGISM